MYPHCCFAEMNSPLEPHGEAYSHINRACCAYFVHRIYYGTVLSLVTIGEARCSRLEADYKYNIKEQDFSDRAASPRFSSDPAATSLSRLVFFLNRHKSNDDYPVDMCYNIYLLIMMTPGANP